MVDHELNDLKREFLLEAEAKVREIDAAIEGSGDLERLAYLAHQLKGSGGSYGYARISAEAAEIEKVAEEAAGGSPAGVSSQLREHVANLRAEIDKSLRELAGAA